MGTKSSVCGTRYVTATVIASRPAAGKRIRASGYASITPSSNEMTVETVATSIVFPIQTTKLVSLNRSM